MAGIVGSALTSVKSQLDRLIPTAQIEELARELGHRWRKRLIGGPAGTVHLFLLQLLAAVGMDGLRHVSKVKVSGQAVCKAKMKLPLALLMRLVERSAAAAAAAAAAACSSAEACGSSSSSCWHGRPVVLADGTSCCVPDTPELAGRYGKAANARGASRGFPMPKLLASLDLLSGCLLKVIAMPAARQEHTCLTRLFKAVPANAVVLGDRGLGGFAPLAMARQFVIEAVIRLQRSMVVFGRGKGAQRRVRRLGKQDLLVSWRRDRGLRRPRWMSRRRWEQLPTELTLRQVGFRIVRPGFRTHWAWIVTTLTDERLYPAEHLVQLYAKRWQVEVYFRDLKQTLGLKRLSARTPAGVRKELLALALLYNLVRQVMLDAGRRQQVDPARISFTDALRWLLWSTPDEPLATLRVNPCRARRTQPRKLKAARKRYTQLNGPRESLSKPACEAKL